MSVLVKTGLALCVALIAVAASFGVGALVGQPDLPQIGDPVILEERDDRTRPGSEISPKPGSKAPREVTPVFPEPRPIDDDGDDDVDDDRGGDDDRDDDDDD